MPLIDRIQQNLQPTTTWADVAAPVITVVPQPADVGFQAITSSTPATIWFSAEAAGVVLVLSSAASPESAQAPDTIATSMAAASLVEPALPQQIGALVEIGPPALAVEPAPIAPSAPEPPAIPPLVEVGPPALGGEAEAAQPTSSITVEYIPATADTFAFITAGPAEAAFELGFALSVVVTPLYPATVQDVANAPGPLGGSAENVVLTEVGPLAAPGVLAEAPSPFIGMLAAAAIAFAPASLPDLGALHPTQVRIEEPAQPLPPQLPYDWLWGLDIKWEAEPPPDKILIEEPLRPEPTFAYTNLVEPWQPFHPGNSSNDAPQPQPVPPTPPPPAPTGGGGYSPNPFGVGGSDCKDYCGEEPSLEYLRKLSGAQPSLDFLGQLPPAAPPPPALDTVGVTPAQLQGQESLSDAERALAWLKDPKNRKKVKKAVRWGLGAWAVVRKLRGDDDDEE